MQSESSEKSVSEGSPEEPSSGSGHKQEVRAVQNFRHTCIGPCNHMHFALERALVPLARFSAVQWSYQCY